MFTGEHPLTIDEKGRLAVPARFRQLLAETHGPQLYVVPITNSERPAHLEVFPAPVFKQIADQIDELQDAEAAETLKQELIGRAMLTELDAQGRITLTQKLRDEVRLNGRALVVGQSKRFDIWDETVYGSTRADAEKFSRALRLIKR